MIYVLVAKTRIVTGHGESGEFFTLAGPAYRETETYPAFGSKTAAEEFLKGLGQFTSYKIHQMELK